MLLSCSVADNSWESLGQQGNPTNPSQRKSGLNIHWKDWCWSWSSSTLATWCEVLTHLKRPWCWERLKAGGEGDDRGWDGWMASLTQWVNSGIWWWTGKPSMLQSMGLQRVGHNWVTELNWSGTFQIRELWGDWLMNLGDQEVPWSATSRPSKAWEPGGVISGLGSKASPRTREDWSLSSSKVGRRCILFYFNQSLNNLDDAQPHWGRLFTLLNSLI